jgi:hypothetical protein
VVDGTKKTRELRRRDLLGESSAHSDSVAAS